MFAILGTDLRFSTAFHPQTDGQSEVTIRVLENFLRPYVERRPSTWATQLSLAEFAANNAINSSTGFTPFFLNNGDNPKLPQGLMIPSTSNQAVTETIDRMRGALEDAKANLETAQQNMKRRVDKTRRAENFAVGDEVVLSTKNLRTYAQHLPIKLRRRWVGPFRISQVISSVAYKLELPVHWHIHPVFHIDKLKRFYRSREFVREVEPPPPELVEGYLEYEVESIVRHKGEGARRRYLVVWKGYPLSESTWEPEANLTHASEVLADYLRRVEGQKDLKTRIRGAKSS